MSTSCELSCSVVMFSSNTSRTSPRQLLNAVPTVSNAPTETDQTKEPSSSPVVQTPSPSSSPVVATLQPSDNSMSTPEPSKSPISTDDNDGTPSPTTTVKSPPPRENIQMALFGLNGLNTPGQLLYNDRTAQYIESFYNNYNGEMEDIRGQVLSVDATVTITGQTAGDLTRYVPSADRTGLLGNISSKHHSGEGGGGSFVPPSRVRFGDIAMHNTDSRARTRHERTLQFTDEDCTGEFLSVDLKIDLTYRLTDPSIDLDDIISEPFSKEEYRFNYVNSFLKSNEAAGIGSLSQLTCTSAIVFLDKGDTPTLSPSAISAEPTSISTEPTTSELEPTLSPTYGPSISPTSEMPTTETLEPTSAVSDAPTLSPSEELLPTTSPSSG
jgi:hypothetical protein